MSKAMRPVIGGETHATKKAYAVVAGTNRKIKRGYVVSEGLLREMYSAGVVVSFSGNLARGAMEIDGVEYSLYTISSSGTLTLAGDKVRYWMCGGGAGGRSALDYGGGEGGGGGYATEGILMGGTYPVVIGAGGAEDASGSASSITIGGTATTAGGATGKNGGTGGGGAGAGGGITGTVTTYVERRNGGTGDGVQKYPFGVEDLKAHCAGGGGGSQYYDNGSTTNCRNGANGGTNGGDGESSQNVAGGSVSTGGTGGEYGGGHGNDEWYGTEENAFFYGGGGGGANAYRSSTTNIHGSGGTGYQGVMYLLIEKTMDETPPFFTVSLTGSFATYRYATVGGTKYTSAAEINCTEDTLIAISIKNTSGGATIVANGSTVASTQNKPSETATYSFFATQNTVINFATGKVTITY